MNDPVSLAEAVHRVLTHYVEIHNDIFGASLWQNFRRALPIPGLFQAIPYAAHAERLSSLRSELQTAQGRTLALETSEPPNDVWRAFLASLDQYCVALDRTLGQLQSICRQMARKAEGQEGPSWSDYERQLAEYKSSRQAYSRLGVQLNQKFQTLRREA